MHGSIIIRGARENNLRDVSLDIPKGAITVFTGVSGSGKSSIVFDTIAAESQRLLNDTMPAFVQNFLPHYGQPDADVIDELSAAIIVDQQRIGGNARSTMGTYTDAYTMLRVLFSRVGTPSAGPSNRYSFNDPTGMCLECEGLGRVAAVDEDALVDPDLSLAEGAIDFPNFNVDSWYWSIFMESGFFDVDAKIRDYTAEQRHQLLYLPDGGKIKVGGGGAKSMNLKYEGLDPEAPAPVPVQGAREPAAARPGRGAAHLDPARRARRARERGSTSGRGRRGSAGARSPTCSAMETRELAALRARDRRAGRRADGRRARAPPGEPRPDRPGLSQPRPSHLDAVGRGVTARQARAPPRLEPHGHDLHLRRAEHRAAPARRAPPQRAARADPRQGQHRARRRARARRDRDRRPRRRHGAGRRPGGRPRGLRRHRRRAARVGDADRHAPRPPPAAEDRGARPRRARSASRTRRATTCATSACRSRAAS